MVHDAIDRQITNVGAGTEDTDAVNVAQLKEVAAVAETTSKVLRASGSDDSDAGAYVEGDNALAAGEASNAIGDGASALGSGANALANNATAIGFNALASGDGAAALGSRRATGEQRGHRQRCRRERDRCQRRGRRCAGLRCVQHGRWQRSHRVGPAGHRQRLPFHGV